MSDTTPQIDFQLYRYTPSIAAAILFTVLFFLTTAFHLYQLIRNKTWYFIAFVLGGICKWSSTSVLPQPYHTSPNRPIAVQIIGYIGRAVAHSNVTSIPIYSIQTILILLAPPLYAASIYMVLGRLIHHLHAESLSVVRLSWMTGIFVTGDVISFVMQAAGT